MKQLNLYPTTDTIWIRPKEGSCQEKMCIGHLRGDFGKNGTEWWSTWHPHTLDDTRNDKQFKETFDEVVSFMRKNVLKDRISMRKVFDRVYCADKDGWRYFYLYENGYWFYMMCKADVGDYNFYIWCYVGGDEDVSL